MADNLEQRIQALEKWKAERTAQQITFPLDIQSQEILNKYFMSLGNLILYEVVGAAAHPIFVYIGKQGGRSFEIAPQSIFQYSVSVSTNELTVPTNTTLESGGEVYDLFVENREINVFCTPAGAFPNPLAVNTAYYIINLTKTASGSVFELTTVMGDQGSRVNITTVGTGPQYIAAAP